MSTLLFKKSILKTEYIPPISTFWAIINSDQVVLEHCENYQKKSTRNRAKILGVNGIEVLSVPLKSGKNSKMPISEVNISYDDSWQSKHLHSIKSAYGNSPYFEYYFDSIVDILRTKNNFLLDLNQQFLLFFADALGIDNGISPTETYAHNYEKGELDLRQLSFQNVDLPHYNEKKYNQVFEEKRGFVGGLSILDLLMCKGPESILYI